MNSDAKNVALWIKGMRNGHDILEKLRIQRIRDSDIVNEITSFDIAFRSAMEIGPQRPMTGLVDLQRKLLKAGK